MEKIQNSKKSTVMILAWSVHQLAEVAIQRCSYKLVFWKYAANLQENPYAEVRFQ